MAKENDIRNIVDAANGNTVTCVIDITLQDDSCMTKSADDNSSEVAPNLYRAEAPSHSTWVAQDELIRGKVDNNSKKGFALEKYHNMKDKKVKHAIHKLKGSNDAITLYNENLLDEPGKLPEASAKLAKPNKKSLLNSSNKKEVGFPFQISKKILKGNSADDHPNKSCKSGNSVGYSNCLPDIRKNGDLNSISSCIIDGAINKLGNEVSFLLLSHTKERNLTECEISFKDEKQDDVIVKPERNLVFCLRRKLLVLDLNGLLADILAVSRNPHRERKKIGGKSVCKRPFCDDFLKFCFETFDIGVWTSRRSMDNIDKILDFIMGDRKHKLLFCWDQSQCTDTGFKTIENVYKPLVLKELKKLWDREESSLPWKMGDYSPSNTLLVDDSPYKALFNPPHTAIFPFPYRYDSENDTSLGPGGDLRVYLEGLALANDVQRFVQEHPFGQKAITNKDSSWDFYLQVIKKAGKSSLQHNDVVKN